MSDDLLVGYVRKSNSQHVVKLSLNVKALGDCITYTTSDGQQYISLVVGLSQITDVLDGVRAVTVISQKGVEEK